MSDEEQPLRTEDFPLEVDQQTIRTRNGKTIAEAFSRQMAIEIARRLNRGHERKEEDRWSA